MKYLLIVFLLLAPVTTYAEDEVTQEKMEVEAFKEYQGKKSFNKEKIGKRVQKTYNNLVKFGVFRLKKKGYDASKLQKQWDSQYSKVFLNHEIGVNDIPDHEPAIKWLNEFYLLLVATLGQSTVIAMHLDDIDTLNRGVPVMFKPAETDKTDYNLCFVKSSAAIGYWTVMGGCSLYIWLGTNPTITICTPLAEGGRLAFKIIADPLSDAIWEGAN